MLEGVAAKPDAITVCRVTGRGWVRFGLLYTCPLPRLLSRFSPFYLAIMSDFEDIDDELLELAGATEKKRKKRQASSSKPSSAKRRKAE